MPSYTTEDIRNLVLVGAKGAGKTTLIEQMLHTAGVIGRPGRVEDHNTVCDYTDLEKVADHSLESALVHFEHNGSFHDAVRSLALGFLAKLAQTPLGAAALADVEPLRPSTWTILIPSIDSIGLTDCAMMSGNALISSSLTCMAICSGDRMFEASLTARLPSASTS